MNTTLKSTTFIRRTICAMLFALAIYPQFAAAGPITSGQLVNIRVGDGTTTPAGTGLPVTLDVYNVNYTLGVPTSVALAQSIPLPTTVTTAGNRALEQGGTAAGEGGLTLSTNGQYMALVGYNTAGGATNSAGSTSTRVVGRLDLSTGTVDTTTALGDILGTNAIRNAFTTDGNSFWTANSAQGVRYTTLGATTSTALTATGNERRVYVYNNQLYTSRQSGTVDGVATVGSPPPPTSGAQTVTLLPGFPTTNIESAYDYFFADPNTLYVADDNSTSSGLQKWTFAAGVWTKQFNLQVTPVATPKGLKSLAGMVDASGNVTLFGSTTDTTANFLYGFTDTLANTNVANVTANKLVTASTDFPSAVWNLRGVAIAPVTVEVPEPATLGLLALGSLLFATRRARKA